MACGALLLAGVLALVVVVRHRARIRRGHRSRIIFIRHGESTANERGKLYRQRGEPSARAYHEAEFFDARLTPAGREEAAVMLQASLSEVMADAEDDVVRLIVPSTLTRALETATLGILPLLSPKGQSAWVALDSVREAMTCEIHSDKVTDVIVEVQEEKPCNGRRPVSALSQEFPHVDFSHCVDEDQLPPLEPMRLVDARIDEFVAWLRRWADDQRRQHGDPTLEVLVVSHYVFLKRLLMRLRSKDGGDVQAEGLKNGEARVMPLDRLLARL